MCCFLIPSSDSNPRAALPFSHIFCNLSSKYFRVHSRVWCSSVNMLSASDISSRWHIPQSSSHSSILRFAKYFCGAMSILQFICKLHDSSSWCWLFWRIQSCCTEQPRGDCFGRGCLCEQTNGPHSTHGAGLLWRKAPSSLFVGWVRGSPGAIPLLKLIWRRAHAAEAGRRCDSFRQTEGFRPFSWTNHELLNRRSLCIHYKCLKHFWKQVFTKHHKIDQ